MIIVKCLKEFYQTFSNKHSVSMNEIMKEIFTLVFILILK